jgi:hypothetical protein
VTIVVDKLVVKETPKKVAKTTAGAPVEEKKAE